MHPELLVRKRIWLMTLVLTGLFLLAAARIAVLTTSEAASLTERGIRQWTKAGIVTARRGTITDRKGRTLAISATAYIVTADPRLVSDTERFLDSIEPVLNINKETARKRLQDKTKGSIILRIPLIIVPNPATSSPPTRISRKSAIQAHCLHAK